MKNRVLNFYVVVSILAGASCGGEIGQTTPVQSAEDASIESKFPVSDTGTERFWAEPSVIRDCDDGLAKTKIHWDVEGVSKIEIRVGSPSGNLFVVMGPEGAADTGDWVRNGMRFYLLNGETREVIEGIRVQVTREGCLN